MKKTLMFIGMLSVAVSYAQEGRVGVNTETPNATLEVVGQPNNTVAVDGIIAPRIDGQQLRAKSNAYGQNQKGAIVYVTDPVRMASNRVGKVKNIDSEGYYYFDGEVWVKFRSEVVTYTAGNGIAIDANGQITATRENTNIYTNDGTLAGNRTVLMNNRSLNFTGGNIGINKSVPESALDISASNTQKVLRFSTKPAEISSTKSYVLFVGEEVNGGYDLRRVSLADLVEAMKVQVPTLRRIAITNGAKQILPKQGGNHPIILDEQIVNTSVSDYRFDGANNYIEILKDGIYEISSWVGFEKLTPYEGDFIVSLAKGINGAFTPFKRAVISRSNNGVEYSVGEGVGVSFSFIGELRKGERLRLLINTLNTAEVNTLKGSVSLSVTRITQDDVRINL